MNVSRSFLKWLPQAVLISALCLLVYVSVQQDLRMSANDPQVQLAEDAAVSASKGMDAGDIATTYGGTLSDNPNAIDMAQSLKPFVIVFDQSGNVLSSSASLSGEVPTPPVGVFAYTSKNGEDRFTWQPIPQARIAAVLTKANLPPATISTSTPAGSDENPGFILAGRSLREIESRESQLLNEVALVWILLLILSFGYSIFMASKVVPAKGNK